ncbi:MAG: hypothetical protein GX638_16575, partial [Crenarchaeota archaeon]|nr:hypothetical protein [Thermoproteota archaeon]
MLKKIFAFVMVLAAGVLLSACKKTKEIKIRFESNGGSAVADVVLSEAKA